MVNITVGPNDSSRTTLNKEVILNRKDLKVASEENQLADKIVGSENSKLNSAVLLNEPEPNMNVDAESSIQSNGDAESDADLKSKNGLEEAVVKLESFTQSIERDLSFSVDQSSGKTVVSVIDTETQEVIRKIPGDAALKLAEEIDQLRSLVFSAKA
ncbi:MAG: flagellar protein FlaG [Pseudomonadales bacterium]|nr:flagellar protein FlaG [Pseudomonadales bacterium]